MKVNIKLFLMILFCGSCLTCNDDDFTCESGECIPFEFKCDGEDKGCFDGSDEGAICDCPSNVTNIFNCPTQWPNSFYRHSVCIFKTQLCDGITDCPLSEDEGHCPGELILNSILVIRNNNY